MKYANFGFGYYLFNTVKELFIKPKSFIICSVSKDMDHGNSYIYFKQSTRSKKKETFPPHFKKIFAYNWEISQGLYTTGLIYRVIFIHLDSYL